MCKASDGSHAGGRVLACMRHLKDRMPSVVAGGQAGEEGSSGNTRNHHTMVEAPILRMLSSDVAAEACCMLDIKSLGQASATCRSLRDVCQGRYPWRLLCLREWGMTEGDVEVVSENIGTLEKRQLLARQRLVFRDSILGADFRRLFPLIEHMPSGFDCSPLLPPPRLRDEMERLGEEGEMISGDFWVKGLVERRQAGQSPGVQEREGETGAGAGSSGDVIAVQVEYRGGIGIGNRCVRADLPLPSTILRDRKSLGVKSHLARQMAASPLAIFRWFLAKMAAAKNGGGAGFAGGVSWWGTVSAPALNPQLTAGVGVGDIFGGQDAGGNQDNSHQAEAAVAVAAVEEGMAQGAAMMNGLGGGSSSGGGGNHLAGVGASASAAANDGEAGMGERVRRASSVPLVSWRTIGGNNCVNRGRGIREEDLPRPMCFPVALGGGVVDVTPRLVSYFEVAIGTPRFEHQHTIPDCIAVGLSKSGFPLRGKMPGWDSRSYGYHSDDGGAFHDAGSMLSKCGPSFGPGDVVGCGLDYSVGDDSADIFFTLNGRSLGSIFHGVKGSFYPTVGIDSPCPVRINLGTEPFVFDLADALRQGGQESAAREAVAQLEPFASAAAPATDTPSNVAQSPEGASTARGEDRPRQHSGPLSGISQPLVGRRASCLEIALSY